MPPGLEILKSKVDLNIKHKLIKCLDQKIGENLLDQNLSKRFLDMTPKTKSIKDFLKYKKTGLHQKLKTFAL